MAKQRYKEHLDFIEKVGFGKLDDVAVTHEGYPLSQKEVTFIDRYMLTGNLNTALREANLKLRDVAGKDYISEEIKYRNQLIADAAIADTAEIMQYFTRVMRNEEKDQFGLDAPISERTVAAKELAKRIIDFENLKAPENPEIKVVLDWDK